MRDLPSHDDSVTRAVGLLGDRWTFLILREAFYGVRRFGEMARRLGVSRNILSRQLQTLVAYGVLERRLYRQESARYEYVLSEAGRDLYPAIVALMRWADRHLVGPEGPPVVLRHRVCGEVVDPRLVCSSCGEPLDPREVDPEPGPGAAVAASAGSRPASTRRRSR